MPSPVSAHALAIPDRPAVIDDRPDGRITAWTFAELNRQANRLANALLALGVQPGDKVAWCGQNSPGVVRAIHALLKIGATAVPLNYRLTADEAAYVIDNSDALLVYVDAELARLVAQVRDAAPRVRHVVAFDGAAAGMLDGDALMAAASDGEPVVEDSGEHPTTMLYTSGTTGRPKGAI